MKDDYDNYNNEDGKVIPVDAVTKRRPLDPATALRLAKIRRSLARINNLMGKLRDLSKEAQETLREHEAAVTDGTEKEDRPDREPRPPTKESGGRSVGRKDSAQVGDGACRRPLRLLDRPE